MLLFKNLASDFEEHYFFEPKRSKAAVHSEKKNKGKTTSSTKQAQSKTAKRTHTASQEQTKLEG